LGDLFCGLINIPSRGSTFVAAARTGAARPTGGQIARPPHAPAHREWCYSELSKEFPGYTPTIWGITSSSSPKGYRAWGGPPLHSKVDGSVVPCAAGGSLMIAPEICIPAIHAMKDKYGDKIWGKYGFADAFNPLTGWVSTDTLGLDVGMTLLSAENLRSGSVWKWFMANTEPQRAMQLAGIDKV